MKVVVQGLRSVVGGRCGALKEVVEVVRKWQNWYEGPKTSEIIDWVRKCFSSHHV